MRRSTSRRLYLPWLPQGPVKGIADNDLLTRWTGERDEAAFELLVRRHAPMVLGTCRRLLADPNDVDEAFQATFLVLARKAASIGHGELLAAWFHRVAFRAALRLRAELAKSRGRPIAVEQFPGPSADVLSVEFTHVLDEEVAALPARLRAAFILCCLEGMTGAEAARLLGCPPGTVSPRLTRARSQLRTRLIRRGFGPAALTGVAALSAEAQAGLGRSSLIETTLHSALAFAGGWSSTQSHRPAAIAEGVITAMFVQKLTLVSVVLFATVLAVGAVIAGNRPGTVPDKPPAAKDPDAARQAPIVKLVQPQPGGLDRTTSQPCTAEAAQRVDLFPGAAGIIKTLIVDIGDRVKRGQVLVEIDAPNLVIEQRQAQLGVKQAQAGVLEAVARVSIAKAEVEAAQSVVRQRQAEAEAARASAAYRKKQLDRMKELLNQKAIDQHIVDEAIDHYTAAKGQEEAAQAAVESAKADTAVKKSKLDQAEAAVNTARANVEAAELAVEKARFALDHTIICAPFDGVITFRGCSVGELVRTEGPAAGRDPLLTIVQANKLRIVVEVPERDVPLVAVGTPAEIRFDAQPGMTVSGKVSRIAFTENPKTRTMRVEIDVPNADGKLHPGMFGAARLLLGKGPAGAWRVPASAVLTLLPPLGDAKSNAAVYVYRNGKAIMTRVQVAAQTEAEAEILSGLTANDRVVVDPKVLLPKDDVPVQVEPASAK